MLQNVCSLAWGMTFEGRPYARFRRALQVRSVMHAETAAREMGRLGLNDALDYLTLLAAEAPERYEAAARSALGRMALSAGPCGPCTRTAPGRSGPAPTPVCGD